MKNETGHETHTIVMPGLDPGILLDCRVRPGNDDKGMSIARAQRARSPRLGPGPRTACVVFLVAQMGIGNESVQANRAISTGKLNALLRLHTRPINVVVYHGSQGRTRFEVGFPLRCLQRLSRPHLATLHCGWRHNRSTRGAFIPVLSY